MCVTMVNYSIYLNSHEAGPIPPHRGLCQGDLLLLYLFYLVYLLCKVEARGDLHGIFVCRGGSSISHLPFADDNFHFFSKRLGLSDLQLKNFLLTTRKHWVMLLIFRNQGLCSVQT